MKKREKSSETPRDKKSKTSSKVKPTLMTKVVKVPKTTKSKSVSQVVIDRAIKKLGNCNANTSIADLVTPEELSEIQVNVEAAIANLLTALAIDYKNDSNMADTPSRVARMYLREVFNGRYHSSPAITEFPNTSQYDNLIIVGPIEIKSFCSHHLMPIVGQCWVGVLPQEANVIGLSKYVRLVRHIAERPQIQEELIEQIADALEGAQEPEGIAVVIKATHMCMTHRGVNETGGFMTTAVMRGALRNFPALKAEFYANIASMGFK